MLRKRALPFLLVLLVFITGCEGDTIITPFSSRDAHFSMYGFISTLDTQYVRVVPIRTELERDSSPTDLGVTVRSVRQSNGSTEEWAPVRPLLDTGERGLMFSDSTFGHVYRAVFTPFVNETYTLEVIGADGRTSSASVRIPAVSAPVVSDVWTRNDSLFQSLTWPGVEISPSSIEVVYRTGSPLYFPEIQLPAIPVDYTGQGEATPEGWRVDLDLMTDVKYVRQFLVDNYENYAPFPFEDPVGFPMASMDIRMRIIVPDSMSLMLGSIEDPERLSQPGAFSNVENGFGIVGAAGTGSRLWELPRDRDLRNRIGFTE